MLSYLITLRANVVFTFPIRSIYFAMQYLRKILVPDSAYCFLYHPSLAQFPFCHVVCHEAKKKGNVWVNNKAVAEFACEYIHVHAYSRRFYTWSNTKKNEDALFCFHSFPPNLFLPNTVAGELGRSTKASIWLVFTLTTNWQASTQTMDSIYAFQAFTFRASCRSIRRNPLEMPVS